MVTSISHNPQETFQIGVAFGQAARAGWVIGLQGDLGAGKTHWVRGLAHGMQVESRVHSPTFALINAYTGGRLPLFHLDLYRLDSPDQIVQAGLEDYLFRPEGVTVVEWIERWPGFAPPAPVFYRKIQFEIINEQERQLTYEDIIP